MGKIWMAAPLNPKDLMPMVKTKEVISWDRKKGGLVAMTEVRIGAIILGSRPLANIEKGDATQAILEAVRQDGEHLLNFDEETKQVILRVANLKSWNPNQNWPDWSVAVLCENPETWLESYLTGINKNEDFKKLNLSQILLHSLDFNQQKQLNELAPATVAVPSGSNIKIEYRSQGDVPILSVRLQELFGLLETPKVNNGKVSLLIEILSPGYKAVQLTQDLKSFWGNGYFEVKKELKRRYPKHEWPEDPISAEAIRGVKRKN
jgi:ATP-dependent helicase HrpB